MITVMLQGGLGNTIFQIFATIAFSLKYKIPFKFLNVSQLGGGPNTTLRHTYWDSFFSNLTIFLVDKLPTNIQVIRENGFHHQSLPIDKYLNQDVMLHGYFQSYKYFQEYYPVICRFIGLDKIKRNLLNKLSISDTPINFNNTIAMHFRYGDYKKLQTFHPLLTHTYYYNALSYFKNKKPNIVFTIFYFCEEEDRESIEKIILLLSKEFANYVFIKGDQSFADHEQLIYMSICNHNIIANSSFSYFGAYFNSHEDKIVCYPSKWFGDSANLDVKDLCPNDWVKINV